MRITFVTRKFGNVERNSHCDAKFKIKSSFFLPDILAVRLLFERGSSLVECRTRNQVSPGSNPPLLPFGRLGIFLLSIDAPVDSAE